MSDMGWMEPSPERDQAAVRIAMGARPWKYGAQFGVDMDVAERRAMGFHTWKNHYEDIVRRRAMEYAVARARALLGDRQHG